MEINERFKININKELVEQNWDRFCESSKSVVQNLLLNGHYNAFELTQEDIKKGFLCTLCTLQMGPFVGEPNKYDNRTSVSLRKERKACSDALASGNLDVYFKKMSELMKKNSHFFVLPNSFTLEMIPMGSYPLQYSMVPGILGKHGYYNEAQVQSYINELTDFYNVNKEKCSKKRLDFALYGYEPVSARVLDALSNALEAIKRNTRKR